MSSAARAAQAATELRRGADRGSFRNDWLQARFSFSFGTWHDPARDGFASLRALNEDVIQPGTGFGMHPHRDLDIFLLPLAGTVEHRDSLGNHALVKPGQVQRMRAGRGIAHSQMNASAQELDHHLQVWLVPRVKGGPASAEVRDFDLFGTAGRWCTVVSPAGTAGSFDIDHAATMRTGRVAAGHALAWQPAAGAMAYLHVVDGEMRIGAALLVGGDAVAVHRADGSAMDLEGTGRVLAFEWA